MKNYIPDVRPMRWWVRTTLAAAAPAIGAALIAQGVDYDVRFVWRVVHHEGVVWPGVFPLVAYIPGILCGVLVAYWTLFGRAADAPAVWDSAPAQPIDQARHPVRYRLARAVDLNGSPNIVAGLIFVAVLPLEVAFGVVGPTLGAYLAGLMTRAHPTGGLSFAETAGLLYLWVAVFTAGSWRLFSPRFAGRRRQPRLVEEDAS